MNTETYEHSFEVSAPAKLLVKNLRGRVQVTAGQEGVIKIIETRHLDDGDAEMTEVVVAQDESGRVRAEVKMPDRLFGISLRRPQRVDFEIVAPAQTELKVKNVSGPVDVSGLNGQLNLKTVSGRIHAQDLTGTLGLNSVSGKITGTNLTGPAIVEAVSGKVDLGGCDFPTLKVNGVSGRVTVQTNLGAGPYDLSTVSGSISLVIPEDANCAVDASAVSGRFVTDLKISKSVVRRNHWRVKFGQGGTHIRMKSVSGKMRLLSALDASGKTPQDTGGRVQASNEGRTKILERLSEGEIDVEQAVQELGG